MQLIKNVFHQQKTVTRKLEETTTFKTTASQERMLEVYFNIIEWGPNVYGIGEASRFYFQKNPSELTSTNAYFWLESYQVPKKFMYQFNDQGKLRFCY
jgi:membrane peptidoglycan carboxypeptidase